MLAVSDVARVYSTVFAPELFILLCVVVLVGQEYRRGRPAAARELAPRLGVLGAGWLVGLAIYRGVPLAVGPVPKWVSDSLGSIGLVVALAAIVVAWQLRAWGGLVPGFAGILVAISVPHLVITPFWDISSHVLYTVVPAGALAWVDRRFAVLAAVPAGMVLARPLAGVHTWPQSIAGLALGMLALVVYDRIGRPGWRSVRYVTPQPRSAGES